MPEAEAADGLVSSLAQSLGLDHPYRALAALAALVC